MAVGEIIRTRVECIVSGGEGLAHAGLAHAGLAHDGLAHDGLAVFVPLAAPGDIARVKITEDHGGWARAEIVEIEEPSPLRTQPACPHYGICGGCSLQHLNYEAQLSAKERLFKDCFSRIGGIEIEQKIDFRIAASSPLGYRNRVQFHCLPEDRSRLGFKAAKGNTIIPVSACPVADEGIQNALKNRRIKPPPEKDRFNVYSRNGTFLSEGGKSRGKVSILGRELLMDAGLFFQSNAIMLEALLGDLKKAAGKANHNLPMADIYCGVGTFAAFLAEGFRAAELVEKNKAALAIARENAPGKNTGFFALSGDEWAKKQNKKRAAQHGFAIVDPPREGLSPLLKTWIKESGPLILAYVSCNPAALARDAKEIASPQTGPYSLKELTLCDFYPQTAHVESLAIFYRNS